MGILIVRLRRNSQDMPRVICGIQLTLEIISMQRHKELFYLHASTDPQLPSWERFLFAQQNQPVPLLSLDRTSLRRSPWLFVHMPKLFCSNPDQRSRQLVNWKQSLSIHPMFITLCICTEQEALGVVYIIVYDYLCDSPWLHNFLQAQDGIQRSLCMKKEWAQWTLVNADFPEVEGHPGRGPLLKAQGTEYD